VPSFRPNPRFSAALLVVAAGCAMAVSARGTPTRVQSLGGGGDYFEDDGNVLRWYGSLGDYPNLVVLGSGHFNPVNGYEDEDGKKLSGPGAGVHVRFGPTGRWGTGGLYVHAQGDDSDPGSLHREYLTGSFSGLYCVPLGPVQVGLMARRTDETEFQGADGELIALRFGYERTRTDLGLGVRFDLSDRAYVDLAGDVRNIKDSAWGSDPLNSSWQTEEFDSWDNFGLRARGFVAVGERWVLAPLLEYVSEDFTGTGLASGSLYRETSDNDGRLFRGGAALEYYPDADAFLLLSLEFLDGRIDHQLRELDGTPTALWVEDYRIFSIRVAYEVRVAFWMTLRAASGYEHIDNAGTFFLPRTGGAFPLSLGAGMNLKSLTLDLALTDREPQGLSRYAPDLGSVPDSNWLSLTLGFEF
jgi:hypothetical protein